MQGDDASSPIPMRKSTRKVYLPRLMVGSAVPNYLSMQYVGMRSWMMALEWEESPGFAGELSQDIVLALDDPARAFPETLATLHVDMDDYTKVQTVVTGEVGLVADAPPASVPMCQFDWRDLTARLPSEPKQTLSDYVCETLVAHVTVA